jgi:rhodanese-related sulfurtransferase
MNKFSYSIIMVLFVLCPLQTLAEKVITPATLAGGSIVSVSEAKELLGKAQFYDMRKVINFGKGHVPGAVSIPLNSKSEKTENFDVAKDELDMTKFPQDKKSNLVFYSDGPYGWKSYKASVIAIKNGYSNVKWMRDGFESWTKAGNAVE